MQTLKHDPKNGVLHPGWLLAVRFFIGLALLIGAYLLVVSLRGMNVVGCGPESGCEKVLHSRWAYWFGLPVSIFALAVYATIFAATFGLSRKLAAPEQRKIWSILVPLAVLVIGAGLWFAILQFFVIKAICPFCMAAHGSGLIAALLVLFSAPFGPVPEKAWQREKQIFIPPRFAQKLLLLALAGVATLVAGQTLHQKKTFAVASIADLPWARSGSNSVLGQTNSSAEAGPLIQSRTNLAAANVPSNLQAANAQPQTNSPANASPVPPNPYAGKFFVVYQTNVLDLRQAPIIGSSNAPRVMVSLYDYTCHHCRLTHHPLMEVFRAFSNEIAIVSLPMPLDPACNYTVKRALGPHTNACQYARIGLAVWRANRGKMPEFDEFMFASEKPPSVEAARQFAIQLTGAEAFERARQDPWIDQQLQQDIAIYDVANRLGRGNMPQIIIGRQVVLGHIDRENLFRIVGKEFGLRLP